MKIVPILLDSKPPYVAEHGHPGSLLLLPLGTHTLVEHLCSWLQQITNQVPMVLPTQAEADTRYATLIGTTCPTVRLMGAGAVAKAVVNLELSDALLIIDARFLPLRPQEFSKLVHEYSQQPHLSHHLVAFEGAVAGTKERISFDADGHVRRILRHYEPATWPFIAGVTASIVPVSSGMLGDGVVPDSLSELRQALVSRGLPSRDVIIESSSLDLNDEAGLLAASDLFVRRLLRSGTRGGSAGATPVRVGSGQTIHPSARISGPVAIHANAEIGAGALVLGPAVIGVGAKVLPGSVLAQSLVGPGAIVPAGVTVRSRAWFGTLSHGVWSDQPPLRYSDRLASLITQTLRADGKFTAEGMADEFGLQLRLKRVVDVTVSLLLLTLLLPLLLAVAAAVWVQSRGGSVLYADKREGVGGRTFKCWKFRTMTENAHAVQAALKSMDKMDGPHFKLDKDPRVTSVGRVLRALNLDELPQLLNVLQGEMSLVGPRPSPFRENQVCVPWREARLSVRPGITGFWQVCRHNRSAGDFHQWIEYDLLYVQHLSLWLDVKILVATFVTFGGKFGHTPANWLVPGLSC